MGIELELFMLLVLQLLGTEIFGEFERGTPAGRKVLKWAIVHGLTIGLYFVIGHWALLIAPTLAALGLTVHFAWCGKNGIDPLRATPRRKYYELRGWPWPEE
jgi:hypothetical protein